MICSNTPLGREGCCLIFWGKATPLPLWGGEEGGGGVATPLTPPSCQRGRGGEEEGVKGPKSLDSNYW